MNSKRIPIVLALLFITCVGLVYFIGSFRPLASTAKFENPPPPPPLLVQAAPVVNTPPPSVILVQSTAVSTGIPTATLKSQPVAALNSVPSATPRVESTPELPKPPSPTRTAYDTPTRVPTRERRPRTLVAQAVETATEASTFIPEPVAATLTSIPALKTFEAIGTRALTTPKPKTQTPARAINGSTNFLLIGTDTRTGDPNWKPNTDVMMVLFLDTTQQRAALLSLPRDLVVAIPGHQAFRINSAFHFGWEKESVAGGVAVLKQALQNDFDIRVDHWALIDFEGLAKLIDTLGGIQVNVSCALSDTIDQQAFTVPAGIVNMDYLTAKRYVQSRYTTSDTSRNYRQQRVLWAIAKKALALNAPDRIPAMYAQLKDSIATDMSLFDMVGLIPAIYQLDLQNHPEHLHARVLEAPNVYPWVSPNGAWLYMPNYDEISKTLDTVFDAPQLTSDEPTQAECPARASTPFPTDAPTPIQSPSVDTLTPTPHSPDAPTTEMPTSEVAPTDALPPTEIPTSQVIPTEALPTETPTIQVVPTDALPPTEMPTSELVPTETPTSIETPTSEPRPSGEITPTPIPANPPTPELVPTDSVPAEQQPQDAPTATSGG